MSHIKPALSEKAMCVEIAPGCFRWKRQEDCAPEDLPVAAGDDSKVDHDGADDEVDHDGADDEVDHDGADDEGNVDSDQAADGNVDNADGIDYDQAVAEAKRIVAPVSQMKAKVQSFPGWYRLGELADRVEKKWGEQKLERFARDIGENAGLLKRHRSVFRAWKGAPGRPKSFETAKALQTHPRRFDLIREKPDTSKRQALKLMKQLRDDEAKRDPVAHRLKTTKRSVKRLLEHANKAVKHARMADDVLLPKQRQALREVFDPTQLAQLCDAYEAYGRIVACFKGVLAGEEEPPEE